jgi:kinesin family protein 6/9
MNASDDDRRSVTADSNHIRIYARVRPVRPKAGSGRVPADRYWVNQTLSDTDKQRPVIGFKCPRDMEAGIINNQKQVYEFQFDRIFDTDTKQEEVFDVVAKPVIQR